MDASNLGYHRLGPRPASSFARLPTVVARARSTASARGKKTGGKRPGAKRDGGARKNWHGACRSWVRERVVVGHGRLERRHGHVLCGGPAAMEAPTAVSPPARADDANIVRVADAAAAFGLAFVAKAARRAAI